MKGKPITLLVTGLLAAAMLLASLACNAPLMGGSDQEARPGTAEVAPPEQPLQEEEGGEAAPAEQPEEPAPGPVQPEETVSEPDQPAEPASEGADLGSRAAPIPLGELLEAENWDLQVLQVLRGEPAYQLILAGDSGARPAPAGMEYVAAQLMLRCKFVDEYSHSLGITDLLITGSGGLSRRDNYSDVPAPEVIYTDAYTDEELIGWLDALVPLNETDLMLYFQPDWGEISTVRLLALEEDASVAPPGTSSTIPPSAQGHDPGDPAPYGQPAISDEWAVTVTTVLEGEEALALLQTASSGNQGADEGMALVLVKMRIRYLGSEEVATHISTDYFALQDPAGQRHEAPRQLHNFPADPPWLWMGFFPGGEYEGWAALQAPGGASSATLVFMPDGEFTADSMLYLSLQP